MSDSCGPRFKMAWEQFYSWRTLVRINFLFLYYEFLLILSIFKLQPWIYTLEITSAQFFLGSSVRIKSILNFPVRTLKQSNRNTTHNFFVILLDSFCVARSRLLTWTLEPELSSKQQASYSLASERSARSPTEKTNCLRHTLRSLVRRLPLNPQGSEQSMVNV